MKNIFPGDHGSTYGGYSLACAVAQEAIQVIIDEKLSENSKSMGNVLLNNLSELRSKDYIKDLRGIGLFCAIEF